MQANDDVDYVALIVHVIFGLKAQKYMFSLSKLTFDFLFPQMTVRVF